SSISSLSPLLRIFVESGGKAGPLFSTCSASRALTSAAVGQSIELSMSTSPPATIRAVTNSTTRFYQFSQALTRAFIVGTFIRHTGQCGTGRTLGGPLIAARASLRSRGRNRHRHGRRSLRVSQRASGAEPVLHRHR